MSRDGDDWTMCEEHGEARRMSEKELDVNSTTLGALAEPSRKRIAELLRGGPLSVGEIADKLGLRQPQTSKHLKVLTESGILAVTADANRRIYTLRPEPFRKLDAWLHTFQGVTEARLDSLDDYLRELRDKDDQQDP